MLTMMQDKLATLFRRAVALTTVLTLVACSGEPEQAAPQVRQSVAADTPRAAMPGDSICPRDGLWRPCALVDRIVRAGVGFRETGDTVQVQPFTVDGIRYRVGRADTMTIFYYADSVAAKSEIGLVDTMPRAYGDTLPRGEWPTNTTFIWNGNVIAALVSSDARQIERIRLAITAGAPYTDPRLR